MNLPRRLLCVLLWTGLSLPAAADDHERIRQLVIEGRILPLEQILQAVRERRAGRVLETELERRGGRHVYEVEVLDEHGIVWELYFDAATGEFLKEDQED